ncbi:MAG: CxxxxCH/CxxCH domain-containing protein [Chloroflexota bacterium]
MSCASCSAKYCHSRALAFTMISISPAWPPA